MPSNSIDNGSHFQWAGQQALSNQQRIGTTQQTSSAAPNQISARTAKGLSLLGKIGNSWFGHGGVKLAAGIMVGLGAFASMTGIGACAGVPLMVAGGMLWSASSGTSAIASFEQARIEGSSISSASFAAAKDIGMSTLTGVGAALFILVLALDAMAIIGGDNPVATQAFLGVLDSTHSSGGAGNKRKHQNNIDSS